MYMVSRLSAGATIRNVTARRPGLVIGLLATAGLLAPFLGAVFATPSSGLTTVPVARGTIAEDFKIHAHTDQLNVKIESKGPVDVVVNNNKLLPGGTVGWHSHTGPVVVQIRRGTMTLYDGADPECTPTVFYAGEAFVENVTGDSAHTVRNEGTEDLEWTGTSFIPVGGVGRIDRPAPGNCPF